MTAQVRPTVAVVHATSASVGPAAAGLAAGFPEATAWTLLDDRLVSDAEAAAGLTPALAERMRTLITYAVANGADAVLLCCSMYGPVLEQAGSDHPGIPMASSDEALFAEIARRADDSVLVLGLLAPAVADTTARLQAVLDTAGSVTTVRPIVVDGLAEAVRAGDQDTVERRLVETVQRARDERVEAVVLANFSISPARAAVARATGLPVLTPTVLAATALRDQVVAAAMARTAP